MPSAWSFRWPSHKSLLSALQRGVHEDNRQTPAAGVSLSPQRGRAVELLLSAWSGQRAKLLAPEPDQREMSFKELWADPQDEGDE